MIPDRTSQCEVCGKPASYDDIAILCGGSYCRTERGESEYVDPIENPPPTYINPPEKCDICRSPISTSFVDGPTFIGQWANMCDSCWSARGRGTGTRYTKAEGKGFVKQGSITRGKGENG